MLANVRRSNCTKQRVGDRVRQHVRVRMSFETAGVRDLNAAENQFSAVTESVNIVPDARTDHGQTFRLMTPLDAMTLNLSFMSVRGRISTVPPAVSIRIQPA